MTDTVRQVQDWLRAHEDDLLRDTVAMLRIPSLEDDAAPGAPFGTENRRALDLALSLATDFGFRTKDVDGYGGWAEFGEGSAMVMSMGHLDVVPVGPGWKHEPFGAEIDEGYIYARGATDDKGPTMAAFYAARAIKECVPEIPARLRLFFGCNEESGFKCIEHYNKTEEMPTLGVAPDSGWPLYHAEKGIANALISVPIGTGSEFDLLEANGGQRPNIVIDSCTARVRIGADARKHVTEKLSDSWDKNLSFSVEGDILTVNCQGKAAHGAMPFWGDSAATRLFRFLMEISPIPTQSFYEDLFALTHVAGLGLGIHGCDEPSGDLTSNLGVMRTKGSNLILTVNIRRPVTWESDQLLNKLETHCKKSKHGWSIASFDASAPLYFPLDHILVKTICEVYQEETGDMTPPGVMGGGTYARAVPNCVSIGTAWEGDGPAHQTDERYKVEHLFKASRIYAHMFLRLLDEAAKIG